MWKIKIKILRALKRKLDFGNNSLGPFWRMESGIISLLVGSADPSLRKDIQSEKSATKSEFGVRTENGDDINMAALSER